MNEISDISNSAAEVVAGPPASPPPGPIMQSVLIGFRVVYIVTLLLGAAWLLSNIREIDPDSQAVVLRFGRIVHTQKAGLLLAWPRPIEQVRLLPGPDRQLSHAITALAPVAGIRRSASSSAASGESIPASATSYITGDNNVVLFDATLIYHVSDPAHYYLSQSHVGPALDRLFRGSAVDVAAQWSLNDFIVAQPSSSTGGGAQTITALRGAVRDDLLTTINAKLKELDDSGTGLGISIDRIDMTAWLPPEAKVAFDDVLTATQQANQNIASARTNAERLRQGADREADRVISAAQATATERVVTAKADTSAINALEKSATRDTRRSLLDRAYRSEVGKILQKAGDVTLVDPKGGARYLLPGSGK
ncbi:MAG TPA: SPFH domain-containing protein [Alphaproteobacteria bacterium]|nr:SPFH domain-containing protein [Alphaproteobacteria bacterium]